MACLKDVIIQELRVVLHQRLLAVTQEILGHVESAVSLALDGTRTKLDLQTPEPDAPVASSVFTDGSQSVTSPATREAPPSYNCKEEFVLETSADHIIKEEVETQTDCVGAESEEQEEINQIIDFMAPISDDDGNRSESYEPLGDVASYSNETYNVERIRHEAEPLPTLQNTESEDSPFVCDVCGKRFKYLYNLRQHKTIHSGDKGHRCNFCKKVFSTRANLQTHVRIHTGEKPYRCDCCGKAFTQNSDLKRHKRTHTGERPYSCDVCGERFTLNGNLKSHRLIHTGLKPYNCVTCGKQFKQKICVKRHKCGGKLDTTQPREQKKKRSAVDSVGGSVLASLMTQLSSESSGRKVVHF